MWQTFTPVQMRCARCSWLKCGRICRSMEMQTRRRSRTHSRSARRMHWQRRITRSTIFDSERVSRLPLCPQLQLQLRLLQLQLRLHPVSVSALRRRQAPPVCLVALLPLLLLRPRPRLHHQPLASALLQLLRRRSRSPQRPQHLPPDFPVPHPSELSQPQRHQVCHLELRQLQVPSAA